jgi:hypothetical protein
MSRTTIYCDRRSGQLVGGIVWEFEVDRSAGPPGIIHGEGSHTDIATPPDRDIRDCPLHAHHVSDVEYQGVALDLFGSQMGDFVPVWDMGGFFVSEAMAARLKASHLTGYRTRDIIVIGCNQSSMTEPRIYYLDFASDAGVCLRYRIRDGANLCPHCQTEPMICPGCANINWPRCFRCGELTLYRPDAPEYSHPNGVALEDDAGPRIVEAKNWDGRDWLRVRGPIGGYFVSNRAKEWMERTHTFPVAFKPALLNIEGVEDKFKK